MIGQNLGRAGKMKLNAEKKEAESGRRHGATAGDRHAETSLVGHTLMVDVQTNRNGLN